MKDGAKRMDSMNHEWIQLQLEFFIFLFFFLLNNIKGFAVYVCNVGSVW